MRGVQRLPIAGGLAEGTVAKLLDGVAKVNAKILDQFGKGGKLVEEL